MATLKEKKAKTRARKWYGMKKPRKGEKICWVAKQDKHGYALGLALNAGTLWLRHLRLKDAEEVTRVTSAGTVFFHTGVDPEVNRMARQALRKMAGRNHTN